MEMTTLAEAVTHFSAMGYRGSFRAEESGLREVFSGKLYPPGDLRIDDLFRFEGETDPGDQVVLFASGRSAASSLEPMPWRSVRRWTDSTQQRCGA